ncbi:ribosomal RNA large subunit methyltransferase E isoform X3 [Cucumis melo var. makuwa]|uniref:Ribosomal RNA large subunit methyltransferase E isoform X3 n=2 Tax=Cucumis melo var. makuwa TaxID=1194695 RepID=A0A5D3D629_CUCMM|nr:ribosomal RNA large subunit methyltransferase E isoform X3 [Cucumis melo var. makuwa]
MLVMLEYVTNPFEYILSAFHHSFDLIRGPGVVALKPIVKFTRTPTVCRNVRSKFGAQDIRELFTDFKLITSGSSIMDLGCAPDARLQVACRSLGPSRNRGSILGIDMKLIPQESTTTFEELARVQVSD